jgi:polyribonucleotide nucleotidyltransferase
MFNIVKKSINWGERTLTLETGKIARQAHGSVVVSYGDSKVLCTIVSENTPKAGIDFLPLTVHYREMAYSAGKIPGGFFKREGKASEKEVLTSRLIDRPLRPLFPNNYHHETQIICTVLSHDGVNDTDIISIIAASAAIAISGVPFTAPIAAANVSYDGQHSFVLNPIIQDLARKNLNLVVAGTHDSVLMVESEANELSEEIMLAAIDFAHKQFQNVIELIQDFAKEVAKPMREVKVGDQDTTLSKIISDKVSDKLILAYAETSKQTRNTQIHQLEQELLEQLQDQGYLPQSIHHHFKAIQAKIVRQNILKFDKRIDGRDSKTVRNIETEVSLLPKTHGSALFTRGETQALVVSTLGTTQDAQIMDSLEGEFRENFMLHYNFLPYSVGEATQLKPPSRREVGHGKLAWRAMKAVLPEKSDFPYTIRIVSEITESNGSSSMATVCGASMSMMDAGIPIKKAVAGIAMGLIKEEDEFVVLSDIMGDEDHLGDMDFKVAGTKDGITALQMDIKISGISAAIMQQALAQAKVGRMHILDKMSESISKVRENISENAPTITTININKDKIKEVIGSGGSTIKKICEVSGAKIDIENDGTIKIAAINSTASGIAIKMIQDIVLEAEIGKIYEGKVVKIVEFGAFVNFLGSKDGLVHISELTNSRVKNVNDVINEGDSVKVLVVGVDNKGKVKLSMRAVNQSTGELDESYNAKGAENASEPKSQDRPRTKRIERTQSNEHKEYQPQPERKYFD